MRKFIKNIKKYYKYAIYSAKSELKSEVANSHLNWLWWILDPVAFMFIYIFIVRVVFNSSEPNFPIFVFIGLTVWNFFNKNISTSIKLVTNNKPIVSKIYVPKYILILQKTFVNFFKMCISWGIVILMMIIFNVPFTINLVYFIPMMLTLYMVTFGMCSILLHFGVFIEDLSNIMTIVLKLMFYMSGIFYSIENRVPAPFNEWMLKINPISYVMYSFRQVMLNGIVPDIAFLVIWLLIGCVFSAIGISLIHKYENTYAKVI